MSEELDAFKKGLNERCIIRLKRWGLGEDTARILCGEIALDAPKPQEEEEEEETEIGGEGSKMEQTHKPKHMQLPQVMPMRPLKSEHLMKTKMERPRTAEQMFLTQEELMKRAEYAKVARKKDSIVRMSDNSQFDSYNKLNNVIKIPVTLACEMVQPYNHGTEKHFKPYNELVKAIDKLNELPIIIEHKQWTPDDLVGYVRELRADSNSRSIKGVAYLTESKLPKFLSDRVSQKMVIPVSIGFYAQIFRDGGIFNKEQYDITQRDIVLDHLAICINSIARCPPNKCGLNLDSEENDEKYDFTLINKDQEYFYIFKEEKENNLDENQKDGDKILEDTTFPENQNLPPDEHFLIDKIKKFLNQCDKKKRQDAEDFILSYIEKTLKGDNMEDNKSQEEIAALNKKINQLEDSIKERQELIDAYEAEKKKELIEKIKKFSVYKDSELEDASMDKLKIIADAVMRFEPSAEKAKMLPKGEHKKEPAQKAMKDARLGPLLDYNSYSEDEE